MKHIPQKLSFSYKNSEPVSIEFTEIGQDMYMSTEDLIPALQSSQLMTCALISLKKTLLKPYIIEYRNTAGTLHFYLNLFGLISFISLVSELDSYDNERLLALREAVTKHLQNKYIELITDLASSSYHEGKELILNQFDAMAGEIKEVKNG